MLLLVGISLAAGATTFGPDPSASGPPLMGFAQLLVDPIATLPLLHPEDRPSEPASGGGTDSSDLVFTNPTTQRVTVAVSGRALGTVNPHSTVRIVGLEPGNYRVGARLPNGFQRDFLVAVVRPPAPTVAPTDSQSPAPPPPAP